VPFAVREALSGVRIRTLPGHEAFSLNPAHLVSTVMTPLAAPSSIINNRLGEIKGVVCGRVAGNWGKNSFEGAKSECSDVG
jgi:hypothetical protein